MLVIGGAEEDRTPDLRIANATLSQLSYGPNDASYIFTCANNWCLSCRVAKRCAQDNPLRLPLLLSRPVSFNGVFEL
jgi:hypothetical protein